MYVSHKDREQFSNDLRTVYTAPTEEAALMALEEVKRKWPQYEYYLKRWQDRWADLSPFFGYPEQIKRLMYTTNAIESLNSQLRRVVKAHQVMPHDEALLKALWLAQGDITRRWTKPVYNWGEALAQFAILFPDEIRL
ncbi:MAG: transposase [Patescibacteria group bacterium]|nr:transposase [Patescibacteria group bacterium]